MALAVASAIAMQFALPNRHVLSPTFLFPAVEAVLLVALLIGQHNVHTGGLSSTLVKFIRGLVIVMTLDNTLAVVELVRQILSGAKSDSGTVLLATGGAVWWTNVVAFSLWFEVVDRFGPITEKSDVRHQRAFQFATPQAGKLAPPNWEPHYLDYLYLAFTNATAFSPTDTMPLTRWAKMLMLVQAAISLVVALMIIARAVGILK
jgi:hypothetical protein